jgi:hypothetical protein
MTAPDSVENQSAMRWNRAAMLKVALVALLASCSGQSTTPSIAAPRSHSGTALPDAAKVYQPLAVGDYWEYTCNSQFKIEDRVLRKYVVNKRTVFALELQVPSSPTKSTDIVQLLANDARGNDWIYGYVVKGKVHQVKATEIVAVAPVLNKHYNYPGPKGTPVSRIFKGFEYTNRTPLGVFWVAPYFDSGGTHNYGYSLGRGVMEEDHGPNYKYDCLIEKYVLH